MLRLDGGLILLQLAKLGGERLPVALEGGGLAGCGRGKVTDQLRPSFSTVGKSYQRCSLNSPSEGCWFRPDTSATLITVGLVWADLSMVSMKSS